MSQSKQIDLSRSAMLQGDAFDLAQQLPPNSIDLILTSPPYWGLRDYEGEHNWDIFAEWLNEDPDNKSLIPSYAWYRQHGGLLGLEPLPEWYIHNIVTLIELLRSALKQSGSIWLNIGDTYFARWSSIRSKGRQGLGDDSRLRRKTPMGGFRQEKQLLLIPSRVAIALQEHKWILRNDVIWYKPNVPPRPEKDRLALTHEHFFHFVKKPKEGRAKYYYNFSQVEGCNHDVMELNVKGGKAGHSATFSDELIAPRLTSSCPVGGVVLDPFAGTGTTVVLAQRLSRIGIGFEANKKYANYANRQLAQATPDMFADQVLPATRRNKKKKIAHKLPTIDQEGQSEQRHITIGSRRRRR